MKLKIYLYIEYGIHFRQSLLVFRTYSTMKLGILREEFKTIILINLSINKNKLKDKERHDDQWREMSLLNY